MDEFFKPDASPASTPPPPQPDQSNDFFAAGTFYASFAHRCSRIYSFPIQFFILPSSLNFSSRLLTTSIHLFLSFDDAHIGETDGFVSAGMQSMPSNEDFTRGENTNTGTPPPKNESSESFQPQQQQNQEQMEREMSHASIHSSHSVHSTGQGSDFNDAGNTTNAMNEFVSAPAAPPLDEGDFGAMQQGPSSESVDAMGTSTNSLENSSMQQQSPLENVAELGDCLPRFQRQRQRHRRRRRDLLKEYLAKIREELEQKSKLEREEIDTIKEEAVAELELMRNQRKKMIDANVAKNRSEQDSMTEVMATETGWEAVASLISEENFCPVEDGQRPSTDLGKMRGLIKTLKYKKPQAA